MTVIKKHPFDYVLTTRYKLRLIKELITDWRNLLELFWDLEDILKYTRTKAAYEGTDENKYPEWLTKLRLRHFTSMNNDKKRLIKKWKEIISSFSSKLRK